MKIAFISDIHANIRALEAVLADAHKEGADQIAILGDLVGYGAEPRQVMDKVMALSEQGAWVLRGNHDESAMYPPIAEGRALGQQGVAWTHEQLSPDQLKFIKNLPLTLCYDNLFLVHASARDPEKYSYVNDEIQAERSLDAALAHSAAVRYVFGGHVHQQSLYYRGQGRGLMAFTPTAGIAIPVPIHRYWVCTVGSVGQPRDKKVQAMYALLDSKTQKLMFRRVPYDHISAAEAIRQTEGLPSFFADRLLLGQ